MKICMLTSGHDIYDNRIYYKEILSLKKEYDEIYLVAPGDKDFVTEEGINVKCFEKRKSWHDRIRPMQDMFDIAIKIKADVYHAHEPDSFQVAVKLKNAIGSKAVYDSHEYHPEGFSEHFKIGKGLVTKIIYDYEKKLGKQADLIISVNDILINKFKSYNENVALLPNYPMLSLNTVDKEYGQEPVFVYVGGLREDRGILKILEAIKLVEDKCKYIFIGPFENDEFKNKAIRFKENQLKDKDVTFKGKIPHKEVFDYLKRASAGFVLLQPSNWRYVNSEPIKIFEYMMSKTAVIASDFPMMRNIVKGAESGLLVKPQDIDKIAEAIRYIINNKDEVKLMGERGFARVKEMYNWSICEKRLLEAYKNLD
ncbi:glycosyltransferase family 4 protein [Haloimpatiens sp. FM7315]|uniref:glycosyltransferase family 4 protein n=1 Tax=Haloimpatiens sp. FM7315 TaxID=3298609 RepID=UPI0035A332C4